MVPSRACHLHHAQPTTTTTQRECAPQNRRQHGDVGVWENRDASEEAGLDMGDEVHPPFFLLSLSLSLSLFPSSPLPFLFHFPFPLPLLYTLSFPFPYVILINFISLNVININ